MEGQPPSAHAVRALKELGIDISQQRSRMLTPDLIERADYIFGMTHSHVDSINLLFPYTAEKTFLLREFDETLDEFEKDISDPIGGSYETYAYTRDQIEQGIFSLLNFIGQTAQAQTQRSSFFRAREPLALGADHAGFALKEASQGLIYRKPAFRFKDLGTHSEQFCDYSEFGRPWPNRSRPGEANSACWFARPALA